MIFLQLKNKQDGKPRLLELGKEFTSIGLNDSAKPYLINKDENFICALNECYEARQLIEAYGICEFDVLLIGGMLYLVAFNYGRLILFTESNSFTEMSEFLNSSDASRLGSVFEDKSIFTDSKQLNKAMEMVNEYIKKLEEEMTDADKLQEAQDKLNTIYKIFDKVIDNINIRQKST